MTCQFERQPLWFQLMQPLARVQTDPKSGFRVLVMVTIDLEGLDIITVLVNLSVYMVNHIRVLMYLASTYDVGEWHTVAGDKHQFSSRA